MSSIFLCLCFFLKPLVQSLTQAQRNDVKANLFPGLKDFRVDRRKMKEEEEKDPPNQPAAGGTPPQKIEKLNLGLFSKNAPAILQSTLKVPGESLSEGEPFKRLYNII